LGIIFEEPISWLSTNFPEKDSEYQQSTVLARKISSPPKATLVLPDFLRREEGVKKRHGDPKSGRLFKHLVNGDKSNWLVVGSVMTKAINQKMSKYSETNSPKLPSHHHQHSLMNFAYSSSEIKI